MPRFVEGQDRHQVTLLPESLDEFIAEDNAVRVVDAFVEELDLVSMGFEGTTPAATGRPSYDPAVLLLPSWPRRRRRRLLDDARGTACSLVAMVSELVAALSKLELRNSPQSPLSL
jgi:hypothetical protein